MATAAPLADHLRIGMGRSALALALGRGGDVPGGLAALAPVLPLVAGADDAVPARRSIARSGLLHLWAGDAEQALALALGRGRARPTAAGRPTSPSAPCRRSPPRSGRPAGADEAAATAARAVELARERDMPAVLADASTEQARQADGEAAFELHHEALAIRAEHGLRGRRVESLEAVAALGTGSAEQDVRLLAAAAAARDALSLPIGPSIAPSAPRARRRPRRAGEASTRRGARAPRCRSRTRPPTPAAPAAPAAAPTTAGRASRRPSVEVVRLAVDGLTNPEIGARLFMSRSTVKTHLSHVYAKLGVANRTELAARSGDR